jgi:rhodanese-related sulfurtransferase
MKTLFILLGITATIYISYRLYRVASLAKDLEKKLTNGAIILDVRTQKEYEMGHIPGSINLSLGEIRERYVELDSTKTYITCCSHGLRSVKAEQILKEKGFKHVYNGGAWTDLRKLTTNIKARK